MKDKRFLNIILAFTLLVGTQLACNTLMGAPVDVEITEEAADPSE